MKYWTAEWRDSETDQLLSCESIVDLKNRPKLTYDALQLQDSVGLPKWIPGKATWDDMEITYKTEDLGQVLLAKWLSSHWAEHPLIPKTIFADVSLRCYENDKLIEDWYLEKCFTHAVNYRPNGSLEVIFKIAKAYALPISSGWKVFH